MKGGKHPMRSIYIFFQLRQSVSVGLISCKISELLLQHLARPAVEITDPLCTAGAGVQRGFTLTSLLFSLLSPVTHHP